MSMLLILWYDDLVNHALFPDSMLEDGNIQTIITGASSEHLPTAKQWNMFNTCLIHSAFRSGTKLIGFEFYYQMGLTEKQTEIVYSYNGVWVTNLISKNQDCFQLPYDDNVRQIYNVNLRFNSHRVS